MIVEPRANPSSTYADGLARARAIQALDDDRVLPAARTLLLEHGEVRPWSVVLLHGLTNNPAQFARFAPLVHARGANVFAPRLVDHGYRDRLTPALASITAEQMLASAYDAVDLACGLGERVAVLGISLGGLQSAYLAQFRDDVATSVPIAPDFALLQLPYGVSKALGGVMRALPNMFLWWDPRIREEQRPLTAYPRFPTRALMQTLRIADAIYTAAKREPARAGRIAMVVNRADPAVNNEVTMEVVTEWRGLRRDGIEAVELRSLPENHDIIDPDNPLARTDLVYPKLLETLAI